MPGGKPIVLIIHAQTDPPLKELDEEAANLSKALLNSRICDCFPRILLAASSDSIFEELRERGDRIVAVHYAGHANGQGVKLKGNGDDGKIAHIEGLAPALGDLPNLKLLFLNGCATEDQVPHFTDAGIPAVIATSRKIDDRVATEFAKQFYQWLADGNDIQLAFRQAESRIKTDIGKRVELAFADKFRGALEDDPSDSTDEWPWKPHGVESAWTWKLSDSAPSDEAIVEAAGNVGKAVKTVGQHPEIKPVIDIFREQFKKTGVQIDEITTYKRLHDLLHNVQFRCHSTLMQETRHMDPDDIDWDEVGFAEAELTKELADKQSLIEVSPLDPEKTAWLLELESAADDIQSASDAEDRKMLKKAEAAINRVIQIRLSQMNTELKDAARDLDLKPMLEGLQAIATAIEKTGIFSDQAEQFATGREGIDRLHQRLETLVKLHDAWQDVEKEMLQMFVAVRSKNMEDVEFTWPGLKEMVDKLCDPPEEKWARQIMKSATRFNAVIEEEEEEKLRDAFFGYHRHASTRFYVIDKELKNLCENLGAFGSDLLDDLA